jgi:hypothetical protein
MARIRRIILAKKKKVVVETGQLRQRVKKGEVTAQEAWDAIKYSSTKTLRKTKSWFQNKGAVVQ